MDQFSSAGYLMNHIARQFTILLNEGLKPLGLAPAQFPILLTLWEKDGISQHELVSMADLKQATIANTLARMERDGLILRTKHPNDARVQQIKLTEKSKQLQEHAIKIAQTINQQALSVLTQDEQEAFIQMMNKVIIQQKKLIQERNM